MKAQMTLNNRTASFTQEDWVCEKQMKLGRGEARRLSNEPQQVTVVSGRAWLTQDKDLDDILLEAGQSYRVDRGRAVVVQGLPEVVLQVAR